MEPDPYKGCYRLVAPYVFTAFGELWRIPAGFEYDGASVPRGAWYTTYSPFNPIVMRASLKHDFWCVTRPAKPSSQQAAQEFYRDLMSDGASQIKAKLMRRAVLWFGPQWG